MTVSDNSLEIPEEFNPAKSCTKWMKFVRILVLQIHDTLMSEIRVNVNELCNYGSKKYAESEKSGMDEV